MIVAERDLQLFPSKSGKETPEDCVNEKEQKSAHFLTPPEREN